MKKRLTSLFLLIVFLSISIFIPTNTITANAESNQQKIFNFAINELGLNQAAACGVLANIEKESSFNPKSSCIDTNGLTSYGICQWNGSRYNSLKSFCNTNGYDYQSIEGQLMYLKFELNNSQKKSFEYIKNVPNTKDGAYTSGYNWAKYFEVCASKYFEGRAILAKDKYWSIYGETVIIDDDPPPPVEFTGNSTETENEFYAFIQNTNSNRYLQNAAGNVQLAENNVNDNTQIWKFIRNSDTSYTIRNVNNNTVIDAEGATITPGSNAKSLLGSD